MNDLLAELPTGTRLLAGTEWPVVDQLRRTGPRTWTVVRDLCNGMPRSAEDYRSESAAREAFAGRLEGRKPRAASAAEERVTVRLTAEERARYEAAAEGRGVTLGQWLREAAEVAAK